MIRLVACDIDGTLLHGRETEIKPGILREIRRLAAAGVVFCPTSGRQYTSLRRLFAPVAGELYYVCENGAVIFAPGDPGRVLDKVEMPREKCLELCRDILAQPGCEIQISGEDRSYLCPKGGEIVSIMRDVVGNNVALVRSPEEVPEPIVKVAAYNPAGAAVIREALDAKWRGVFRTAVSGDCWFDFNSTDKGGGLRRICARLGVRLEEAAAFGDSWNDAPMLDAAGEPFIMANAEPGLLRRYPRRCSDIEKALAGIAAAAEKL